MDTNDFHKLYPNSGKGKEYPPLARHVWHNTWTEHSLILDWGAGKGGTARWLEDILPCKIHTWDPYWPEGGTPGYSSQTWDWIYSADVFEHIESHEIDQNIAQLAKIANTQTHIIDLTPARKHLPDGRNAHVSLLEPEAWIEHFGRHNTIQHHFVYEEPDKRFTKRNRLVIHI